MTTWHWLAVEELQGKWNRKRFRGGDDPSWSIVTFVNRCLGDPEWKPRRVPRGEIAVAAWD